MHHHDIPPASTPSTSRLRIGLWRRWGALCFLLIGLSFVGQAMAAVISRGEFQITVPDNWTRMDVPIPLQYGARSPDDATIQLGMIKFSPPITSLDDSELQSFRRGFVKKAGRVISEKTTKIANRPALQIDLEVAKPEGTVAFTTWIVPAEAAVYFFMLDTPESAERTALLDSIRFNASAPLPENVPEVKSILTNPERLGELFGQCMFYGLVIAVVVHFIRRSGRKKGEARHASSAMPPPPPPPLPPQSHH